MNTFQHTDFNRALTTGSIFTSPQLGAITVSRVELGRIALPSGMVIACDPESITWNNGVQAFLPSVAPGSYPAALSLAAVVSDGIEYEYIACAAIALSPAIAVRWEPALQAGQDLTKLGYSQFYGYDVDTGLGSFVDQTTFSHIRNQLGTDWYYQTVLPALDTAPRKASWANVLCDQANGLNAILFSTGFGDGTYPSYWGFDQFNQRCSLVTDFEVLTSPVTQTISIALHDDATTDFGHPILQQFDIRMRLLVLDRIAGRVALEIQGINQGLCAIQLQMEEQLYTAEIVESSQDERMLAFNLGPGLAAEITAVLTLTLGLQAL